MNDYTRTIIATTAARKAAKKDATKKDAYRVARKAFKAAIMARKAAKDAAKAAKQGIITLVSSDRMSNRQYHRAGKKTWWLRQGSDFVKIPWTRGDRQFSATVKLEDGNYILGVGPNDKNGIRQSIVVAGGKLV